jgi:hypothetical protein
LTDNHWIFFKKQLGEIFGKIFLGGGSFWFFGRFCTSASVLGEQQSYQDI